jgi:Na+/proline symporter
MEEKNNWKIIKEKIDLGSIDSAYLNILIAGLTILLTILFGFLPYIKDRGSDILTMTIILLSIGFLTIITSVYYEVKSIFTDNIKSKIWSFNILFWYFLITLFLIFFDLFYLLNKQIYLLLMGSRFRIFFLLFSVSVICYLSNRFYHRIDLYFKTRFKNNFNIPKPKNPKTPTI